MNVKTIIRPRVDPAQPGGRENGRRFDHSRYGEGETAGRQSNRRWSRYFGNQRWKSKSAIRCFTGKYAGQEINVDGTDYLIMKQQDILAII